MSLVQKYFPCMEVKLWAFSLIKGIIVIKWYFKCIAVSISCIIYVHKTPTYNTIFKKPMYINIIHFKIATYFCFI